MRAFLYLPLCVACSDYELNTQEDIDPIPDKVEQLAEPVAITGPSVRVKRHEEVVLDPSASFDPDDEEPEFEHVWWVESAPEDAVYSFPDVEVAEPIFSAESLGVYEIGLLVIDEDGLESSNPAGTTIEVLPWEALELTLSWDVPDVDLDLHLVRPGGHYYSDVDDCFFGNPLPDWGVQGESRDDPHLAADSEGAPSPEIIQLEAPEEGIYEVYVHHFSARDAKNIYATPTLEVMAEGQVHATDVGPKLYGPGKVWKAGTFDWSTLTWTPSADLTTHADLGGPAVNQ